MSRSSLATVIAVLVLSLALGAAAIAAPAAPAAAKPTPAKSPAAKPAAPAKAPTLVERGKYLVMVGHCNDCHTPKKMGPQGPENDPALLLSGHRADEKLPPPPAGLSTAWVAATSGGFTAWAGPWGISYTANLTPDKDTGLGSWTEEIFVSTLRHGKHLGVGRDLLPPMPWQEVGQMTEADLHAMWAYLRSIPPIKNAVPEPQPPAPSAAGH